MMKHVKKLILGCAAFAAFGLKADLMDDFSTDTLSNYNVWANAVTHNSGTGVGGAAGYINSTGDARMTYTTPFTALANNDVFTLSGLFYGSGDSKTAATLGLAAANDSGLGADSSNHVAFGVRDNFLRLYNDGTKINDEETFDIVAPGNLWYEIEAQFTVIDTSIGEYSLSGALYNRGADGTAARTLIDDYNPTGGTTFFNADLFDGSTDLYAGVRFKDTVFAAADDLSFTSTATAAVPEPATFGLLALSGLMLFRRKRN